MLNLKILPLFQIARESTGQNLGHGSYNAENRRGKHEPFHLQYI
jgi:hypothetical protein